MSKKTRKEKLLARKHKKASLMRELSGTVVFETPQVSAVSSSKKSTPSTAAARAFSEEQKTQLRFFWQDFRKSIILVSSIIGLEIAVYYGTMNSSLARIFKF